MTRRVFLTFLLGLIPVAPFAAYVIGLVLGLDADEAVEAVVWVLPPCIVFAGMLQPWLVIDRLVARALARTPGEAPDARLGRILRLPQQLVVLGWMLEWVVGVSGFCGGCILLFHKEPAAAPAGLLVGMSLAALIGIPLALRLEEMLLPDALAEFARVSPARREGFSFFWPRQRWFLPYTFGVFLVATFVLNGAIVLIRGNAQREELARDLERMHDASGAAWVRAHGQLPAGAVYGQVAGTLNLLAVATVAAWLLARRQAKAMQSVREAMDALAKGAPKPPAWVSTDEVGDLAVEMTALLGRMRELPARLAGSVRALADAGAHLRTANDDQSRTLVRQVTALEQTRVTAKELQEASQHAARRAQSMLKVAERAETLGREGEGAIARTLAGIGAMRTAVEQVRDTLARLEQRTAQIGGIAATVKDLADQTNMLALNAAIEAVRSGEHGRAFSVVAREMRSLADQSLQATARIRESLEDLGAVIRDSVTISDSGLQSVARNVEELRASGAHLGELSGIVRESSAAVREIAGTVGQQDASLSELFAIFGELSRGLDDTVKRLDATKQASHTLEVVSDEVSEVAKRFDAA